jgi:hypothetical protein
MVWQCVCERAFSFAPNGSSSSTLIWVGHVRSGAAQAQRFTRSGRVTSPVRSLFECWRQILLILGDNTASRPDPTRHTHSNAHPLSQTCTLVLKHLPSLAPSLETHRAKGDHACYSAYVRVHQRGKRVPGFLGLDQGAASGFAALLRGFLRGLSPTLWSSTRRAPLP